MYHVLSTGIAVSLLYIISFTLYRFGFYTRNFHKKIWNIILACTFLLTASAGLFLALQVNYKWNIPFIKAILKWHVENGIGFSLAGIVHFFRHFTYFLKTSDDSSDRQGNQTVYPFRSAWQNGVNLFLIGLVSSSAQLLLMREMMNIAGGYELITGTFLGSWLIGSAAGSAIARKPAISDLRKINIAFALSLLSSLLLLVFLNRIFLSPGETPSFFVSIILTLLVLFPFTFISGYAFIRILLSAREANQLQAGRSFSIETAGGVTAGVVVPIIGSGILNTYQMILLILILYCYYVTVSFILKGEKSIKYAAIVALLACTMLIILNTDNFFRQRLLPAINVILTEDTPYGNITLGEYGGEEVIYYNHHLQQWQNDETEREENVHYAMVQRDTFENVLVVSGDIGSILPELLKYPVKKIWIIERDPALLKYQIADMEEQPDIFNTENTDAFRFIKKTSLRFDIILLILPPPSTLQLNRYYTIDFFEEVKKKLSKNGVFMCSPGAGENYFNKESTILYSSVYNSLASVFKNVVPVVGNKLYYLASDGELSTSICSLILKKGISNLYVGQDFLADDLIKMKSDQVLQTIDRNVKENSLTVPLACFHFQSYNLTKSAGERIPAYILLILVFLMPVLLVKAKNMVMFASAGALAGFEIILLLTLQSTAGNMYQLTGLIIAGFMTGLSLGAGTKLAGKKTFSLSLSSIYIFAFYFITGLIINILMQIENTFITIGILMILSLLPSFLTGHLFRLLTENRDLGYNSPGVYSSDLAGSALGFIAVSAIAVPLLGIQVTLFLLSVLIFIGLLFGTISNK